MASSRQRFAALGAGLCLLAAAMSVRAAPVRLEFDEGRIACVVHPVPGEPVPDLVRDTLAVAMNVALERIGTSPSPATLVVRLQKPPPFFARARNGFRSDALAVQQGDEILLRSGNDPLKLAFRLGHELSHWLIYRRNPARPPLWLDEGHANWLGGIAAEACARPLGQSVRRPPPDKLARNLYALEELIALDAYPPSPDRSAAFYWQAEALVTALRGKLGPAEFEAYLAQLSSPSPPAWDAPLRARWYFNDWDFAWLARQIRPEGARD
jgi:hypothetical protein